MCVCVCMSVYVCVNVKARCKLRNMTDFNQKVKMFKILNFCYDKETYLCLYYNI